MPPGYPAVPSMDQSRPRRAAIPIIDPVCRQPIEFERPKAATLALRPHYHNVPSGPRAAAPYPAFNPNHSSNGGHHLAHIQAHAPMRKTIQKPRSLSLSSPSSWTPHLYAQPYIPVYLLAINRSPAVSKYTTPLKTVDFNAYRQQFAGEMFLGPTMSHSMPPIKSVPISISLHVRNLEPSTYLYYFDECLLLEAHQQTLDLAQLCLFNVPVEPVNISRKLFQISVPGVKDDTPSISLGDTVLVRQIFHSPDQMSRGVEWLASNQPTLTGSIAPGFNGQQLHAVVAGVSRSKEIVQLRIDHFDTTYIPPYTSWTANILFTVQPDRYVPLWEALTRIDHGWDWPPLPSSFTPSNSSSSHSSLNSPRFSSETWSRGIKDESSWYRHMLFPESAYGAMQTTLNRGSFDLDWVDADLNYEQMKAVDSIISRNYGNVPFLISGVPGSGKTKTVVECTLQILKRQSEIQPHILLCAPSNPAADTLALRLAAHLTPREMFRLNGWARTFAEVPGELLPYTYTDNDIFSLPHFKSMMNYKVVVTTCRDADMLVKSRLTNQDLMKLACETVAAVSPKTQIKAHDMLHWTALLIDEAAQDIEPVICVPLTVVGSPLPIENDATETNIKSSLPLFVMAGDQHQLGPRIHNCDTSLSISLFERLSSHPFYADHPLSRRNAGPYKKLVQEMLPIQRPAFTNLTRNYRSHPAILTVPSVLFYNDTLTPCAAPTRPTGPIPTWSEWRPPLHWPVLFSCNSSPDQVEEVLHRPAGSGVYNPGEALLALHYTKSLIQHSGILHRRNPNGSSPISPKEIAIISPFRSQVSHLRNLFRSHFLHSVNIGPLEAFQGLETRFLIICTTRTRTGQFVKQDQSLGLGLVGEKKRFNVALTRAKEGVVVLGNPNVLINGGKDETWREFLSYCARNGCWATEDSSDPAKGDAEARCTKENTNKSPKWWARKLAGAKVYEEGSSSGSDASNNKGDSDSEDTDIRLSGHVSRLERALLYEAMQQNSPWNGEKSVECEAGTRRYGLGVGGSSDYDSAMWTAGIAAEEVLRDAALN